jgi:surface antigen
MRRLASAVAAFAVATLGSVLPAHASDGYPYAHAAQGKQDPWSFTTRQCTSYVAWRLNESGNGSFRNQMRSPAGQRVVFGNAEHWDTAAREMGDRVSKTPAVGAVAQWNGNERSVYKSYTTIASPLGHVAYVVAVYKDGSVMVDQYDAQRPRAFNSERVRAPRYLYL